MSGLFESRPDYSITIPRGVELSCIEAGDPAGLPVVMLHGYTDSNVSYGPLMDELPQSARLIAISARGHGDSSRPDAGYRINDFVADLVEAFDTLGIERAVVIGHSMGSLIAQRFALDHPRRTLALVLLGAFASVKGNEPGEQFWREVVADLQDPVDPDMVRGFQESTLSEPVPPEFLETVISESLKLPARVWRDALRGLLEDDFTRETRGLALPILLIWGVDDLFCHAGERARLRSLLRQAKVVELEGIGHSPHWEAPITIAAMIDDFIAPISTSIVAEGAAPGRPPQLDGGVFLTDGGLETTLIFHDGLELPDFAAFLLLRTEEGRAALRRYYERYLDIAKADGVGFILESPTWRASPDWARRQGITRMDLAGLNHRAIRMMQELRQAYALAVDPIVVSGCVGPRGDGYDPGVVMTAAEAQAYHAEQVAAFAQAGADMVTATTMTNSPEAIGIVRAARARGLPVVISFTVETDGRLPTGQALGQAIREVDAETGAAPAYYMINCAHPDHFAGVLASGEPWVERLGGLRANASRRSHQELNDAPDLDDGDPLELGDAHVQLVRAHPRINVLGGCCGTDHRHVSNMMRAWKVTA